MSTQDVNFVQEMQTSFLEYSMSVIMARALPDVRDGLKPVQRRIIYAMSKEGLKSSGKFSKCAGVVGEVLKKYHPHGDSSVYDTLVRMIQNWNMRYPLAQGQGNFGSIDGDNAAAYRYTETRLDPVAESLLEDIDLDTVDFQDNYNNTTSEPMVLPSKIPNLLVNGCTGIAVGMATNVPPHNLGEVIQGVLYVLDHPEASIKDLMKIIPGPDFPTGGIIIGKDKIEEAYTTGRASITLTGRLKVSDEGKGKESILVTEIPYYTSKSRIIEKIADLVRNKKIDGIIDIRDESDKHGMRVVLELRKNAPAKLICDQIMKLTPMSTTYGINLVALVNNQPKILSLKEMLESFLFHRKVVIRRRTHFLLNQHQVRMHILEGLTKILEFKKEYLTKLLPNAKSKEELKQSIETRFELSPQQSEAIVVLPNFRFVSLEMDKIMAEHQELQKEIKNLQTILKNPKKLSEILRDELKEIQKKFSDARRTQIKAYEREVDQADLIPDENCVVTLTHKQFLKRYEYDSEVNVPADKSRVISHDDDLAASFIISNLREQLFTVSQLGQIYKMSVFSVPQMRRYGKGVAISELIKFKKDDESLLPLLSLKNEDFAKARLLLMTQKGFILQIPLDGLENLRSGGITAQRVKDNDRVVAAQILYGSITSHYWVAINHKGFVLPIPLAKIPKGQRGEAGTNLADIFTSWNSEEAPLVAGFLSAQKGTLVTVSERGWVKKINYNCDKILNPTPSESRKIIEVAGSCVFSGVCQGTEDLFIYSSLDKLREVNVSQLPNSDFKEKGKLLGEEYKKSEKIIRAGLTLPHLKSE